MGCAESTANQTRPSKREQHRHPHPHTSIVAKETLSSFDTRSRYSHRLLEEDFVLENKSILGEGYNGAVLQARSRATGMKVAVKVLMKSGLHENQLINIRAEVNNYLKLDHPHITRLLHVYEDDNRVCLVMEMCRGKELFDKVAKKKQFTEVEAKHAAYQILLAVSYLHRNNVVHCDLKLNNILYETDAENASLKIIDFGFSKTLKGDTPMSGSQGTLCYAAPEVLLGCYTEKCDIWSVGVIMFLMLSGSAPFPMKAGEEKAAHDKIIRGEYEFKPEKWKHVSEGAKAFIRQCLVVDPAERMSADDCLDHLWMQGRTQSDSSLCSPTPLLKSLRSFSKCSAMKRAVLTMVAHHLNSPELTAMRKLFLQLDSDRTGTITRDNFQSALSKGSTLAVSEQELWEIFDRVDVAHDGEIHYSEFIAAMLQSTIKITKEIVRETFDLFDVSRTGYITSNDLWRVLGANGFEEVDVKTLISQCSSGDVERGITFAEFEELLQGSGTSTPRSGKKWGFGFQRR